MRRFLGLFLILASFAPAWGAEASDPTLIINERAQPEVYGPGLHSDATGRPYRYETRDGETARGKVKQDAYGPGVHQDQYGRPVYATPQ